jgi:hypothetical protein
MDRSPLPEREKLSQTQPFDGFQDHPNDSRHHVDAGLLFDCLLNSLYITGYEILWVAPQSGCHPFLLRQNSHDQLPADLLRARQRSRRKHIDAIRWSSNLLMEFRVIRMTQDTI